MVKEVFTPYSIERCEDLSGISVLSKPLLLHAQEVRLSWLSKVVHTYAVKLR